MRLGYNTNGLADHDLESAIEIVATLGYTAIGLTLDHHSLNPFGPNLEDELKRVGERLKEHELLPVVETGARYLLDKWQKHQPTLVSADQAGRERRVDFLRRAIDIAQRLEAHAVSFWSGRPDDHAGSDVVLARLCESLPEVLDYAAERGVTLGFEPEPGMAIDTLQRYEELLAALERQGIDHQGLKLTIDVGHLHCLGEVPVADHLVQWRDRLVNVHLEDMRAGRHEHLPFGEGEMEFPPIFAALGAMGYTGPAVVELSRDSHRGPEMARRSIEFLRPVMSQAGLAP